MAVLDVASARPRSRNRGDLRLRSLYGVAGGVSGLIVPFWALIFNARGFSASQIGVLLGAYAAVGSVLMLVWSSVADRRLGSARTLRIVLLGSSAASALLALTGSNFVATLIAMLLLSSVWCSQAGLMETLALRYLGGARTHEYGSFRVGASIGWALTVLLFGLVLQRVGVWFATPAFAVGLLGYMLATLGFGDAVVAGGVRKSRLGSCADALSANVALQQFLAGACLIGMGTAVAMAFFPLRIAQAGAGAALVGAAVGLSAALEAPCMLLAGPLVRRYGLRTCFVASAATYVAQAALWATTGNAAVAALVRVSVGFSFGLSWVASVRIGNALVPRHLQNAGQLLLQIVFNGIGMTLGLIWGGLAYQHLGAACTYWLCALCIAIGVGIAWRGLHVATVGGHLRNDIGGDDVESLLELPQA